MSAGKDLQGVLNTLGHDLRGPLFTAQGFLQLVLAKTEGKPHEHAKMAMESVEEAARMVTGVLQWARTDRARMERTRVDLGETVAGASADLETLARRREVQVRRAELPTVEGDPRGLRYAIQHILDNAIRHAPQGSEVHVDGGMEGNAWWVRVRDSGPGIEGDPLRFLEPFWDAADRSAGAGLAIAARVAANHAGELRIDTGPDGTSVTLHGGR